MATLNKHKTEKTGCAGPLPLSGADSGLILRLTFMGPDDSSEHMWGDAWAKLDSTGDDVYCVFLAKARGGSKYDPIHIRIFMVEVSEPVDESERFPLVKISQLTPQAQRYLRTLERTAAKLRTERNRLRRAVFGFEITNRKGK